MTVRLTKVAKRAGCAAKQPPGYLFPLLSRLPAIADPNVLVGNSTADDAAVYKLDENRALVLTTDFFTPIVDDPYEFGAIAAANALSDIYAMGAKPLTGLNLVGFPDHLLEAEILAEILRGGTEKAKEAGIDLIGGHTIKSEEPIYGLAVTGLVHPDRIVSNAGGKPGDVLVLTKPIGTGIVSTAAKNDEDSENAIQEAIRWMSTLNRHACDCMEQVGVHAATDITGFGLLGHLRNVVSGSQCKAKIILADVPFIAAAKNYVHSGIHPGGTEANWRFLHESVQWAPTIEKPEQLLLCDAQTSGGLLIAVAANRVDDLCKALQSKSDCLAAVVGSLQEGNPGSISVH